MNSNSLDIELPGAHINYACRHEFPGKRCYLDAVYDHTPLQLPFTGYADWMLRHNFLAPDGEMISELSVIRHDVAFAEKTRDINSMGILQLGLFPLASLILTGGSTLSCNHLTNSGFDTINAAVHDGEVLRIGSFDFTVSENKGVYKVEPSVAGDEIIAQANIGPLSTILPPGLSEARPLLINAKKGDKNVHISSSAGAGCIHFKADPKNEGLQVSALSISQSDDINGPVWS